MSGNSLFDVMVVGGGHGAAKPPPPPRAAWARTALVTHRADTIGAMSCNPAIGGLGKGHLVREIDALDGLMGRVADQGGIQFRVLNRRKGPAVRGPRARRIASSMPAPCRRPWRRRPISPIVEGEADDLTLDDAGRISGLVLKDGRAFSCGAVVLTTGTFLNG